MRTKVKAKMKMKMELKLQLQFCSLGVNGKEEVTRTLSITAGESTEICREVGESVEGAKGRIRSTLLDRA